MAEARTKPGNLGFIHTDGTFSTEAASWFAPHDLAEAYVRETAALHEGQIFEGSDGTIWKVKKNGKTISIAPILSQLDAWLEPMRNFIAAIQRRDAETNGISGG